MRAFPVASIFMSILVQAKGPLEEPPPCKRMLDTSAAESMLESFRAMHEPALQPWAQALAPVTVRETSTSREATLRLYRDDGGVDESVLDEFARVVAREDEPHPIAARTVQLAFKAAYHFHATTIEIVSAYRPQVPFKGSRHATGDALDFRLPGTRAGALASYLRGLSRVGVGIYTHPRTQYVHLDARDESFHWIDGSPPGRSWREQGMPDASEARRDASYTPDDDLPR